MDHAFLRRLEDRAHRRSGIRLLLLALAALVVAGCGGAAATAKKESPGRQAAKPAPRCGARAFGNLAAGWRTDFSRCAAPPSEFLSGGPGKDGIPAIDRPRFAPAPKIDFLKPLEPVIELVVNGDARAYPLQILIWHEIANDRVGGVPVAVTFCPLCDTAIVFDRRARGKLLDFGTTGDLRNSDLVMYDRQTESWWQQIGGEAVVGFYTGRSLRELPARIVSWREFEQRHPKGLVLTRDTGFSRPYGQNPYTGYDNVNSPPFFPAKNLGDRRLPPKERVVFVDFGKKAVAVPFSVLAKQKVVRVSLAGHELTVRVTGTANSSLDSAAIAEGRRVLTTEVTENGKPVVYSEPFWFAVASFRPKTVIVKG